MAATIRVLAAAAAAEEFDLLLAGLDTSDGQGGAVAAGIAARLGLPLLSTAAAIEPDPAAGRVRVRRLSAKGYDVIEAPDAGGHLVHAGARRAALPERSRGSWRPAPARSRSAPWPTWATRLVPAGGAWSTRVTAADAPPARAAGRVVTGHAGRGRTRDRRLPRGAEAHLMPPVILAVAEVADGAPTKLSTEVATLARRSPRRAGGRPSVSSSMRRRTPRPARSPRYLPRVVAVTSPAGRRRGLGAARGGRGPPARRRGRHARPASGRRPTAATSPGR